MAYYCHITAVTRPAPHNLQVQWEMRNGDLVTFDVVEAKNMIGVSIPLTGTAAQRRAAVVSQIQDAFQGFIDRANGADTVLSAAQSLVGVNYPAAP